MIEWWGPIIHEYYAGTEGNGVTFIATPRTGCAHPGTVGRARSASSTSSTRTATSCRPASRGTIYFAGGGEVRVPQRPREDRRLAPPGAGWSTLGDVGYVDDDGYLFLTDRKAYMIISGGVNIYPQETENVLIDPPEGRRTSPCSASPTRTSAKRSRPSCSRSTASSRRPTLEREIIAFCREHLAGFKCPRSIDFEAELPRLPTGKLYKRMLRDRYMGKTTTIV